MISTEDLVDYNNQMLSLGKPVEKDDVGYNIPDYRIMYNLAYIPADELTPLYQYAMAEHLLHYQNTQLSGIANDLKELQARLVKHIPQSDIANYKALIKDANKDYRPLTDKDKIIELLDIDLLHRTITLHHEGRSQKENSYKKEQYPLIKFKPIADDKWGYAVDFAAVVSFDIIKDYLDMMSYKYVPSTELKDVISRLSFIEAESKDAIANFEKEQAQKRIEEEQKRLASMVIEVVSQGDNAVILSSKAKYPSAISDYINNNKPSGNVRWVKDEWTGKWNIKVKLSKLAEIKSIFDTEGFNTDNIIIPEPEEEREPVILPRKYSPIDVSKTALPFAPYDFQLQDISTAMQKDRMLLGQDMGCGKTLISVVIGESINEPKLVIVPESLRLNWRKEIRMVNPDASINVFYSKDKPADFVKADWNIVGYSTATKYKDFLLSQNFNCVFIDEAHNCKAVDNMGRPASKRADAVMNLANQAEFCYLLTGTPIPTRNKDLYNLLRMLKIPEIDFEEKWAFFNYGKEFCNGYNNGYGWQFEGNTNSDKLHEYLAPVMIRRLKSEVLPNLTKQRTFIPMETHSREYFKLERELEEAVKEDGNEATFMGTAMSARHVLSKDKVDIAMDIADSLLEEDKSVVIVSSFNDTLDTIVQKYGDNCCCIRGGMKDADKQQAIEDFQSGKKKVCALNIIAGGVGVTLTKAHNMVICDYDWTPANMSQVEDRICRAGQTEPCNIQYIYCENSQIDPIFVNMITSKSANIDQVVDNAQNTMDMSSSVLSCLKHNLLNKLDASQTTKDTSQCH